MLTLSIFLAKLEDNKTQIKFLNELKQPAKRVLLLKLLGLFERLVSA